MSKDFKKLDDALRIVLSEYEKLLNITDSETSKLKTIEEEIKELETLLSFRKSSYVRPSTIKAEIERLKVTGDNIINSNKDVVSKLEEIQAKFRAVLGVLDNQIKNARDKKVNILLGVIERLENEAGQPPRFIDVRAEYLKTISVTSNESREQEYTYASVTIYKLEKSNKVRLYKNQQKELMVTTQGLTNF